MPTGCENLVCARTCIYAYLSIRYTRLFISAWARCCLFRIIGNAKASSSGTAIVCPAFCFILIQRCCGTTIKVAPLFCMSPRFIYSADSLLRVLSKGITRASVSEQAIVRPAIYKSQPNQLNVFFDVFGFYCKRAKQHIFAH